jgi:hypothetical protein
MGTQQVATKEVVFDERGETVEEIVTEEVEAVTEPTEDVVEEVEAAAPAPATQGVGKYRIGDKYFETQEAALEYAQSQVTTLETEQQIDNAYRQGMREALARGSVPAEVVTPQVTAEPELNPEELYTDPKAFLDKFAKKIKTETRAEVEHGTALQRESEQIWNEFTGRHPMLADFRTEVENFTSNNLSAVQAIIATKGRPAAYDYVATKLKSRFEAYADAVKPKRALPNTSGAAPAGGKGTSVTQKEPDKKPLSLAEQIRSLRKRR